MGHATPSAGAPRFFVGTALAPQAAGEVDLPEGAAQHVRVRRLQPGEAVRLFDGRGHECAAEIVAIGRQFVRVRVGAAWAGPAVAELPWAVTLAFGVPANERADALVEKATELGAAALQPLMCERSVLRLAGERAERRRAHWQAVAVAACEQCGRATVPQVLPPQDLAAWLKALADVTPQADHHGRREGPSSLRWLLSTHPGAAALATTLATALATASSGAPSSATLRPLGPDPATVLLLSGPEGGFAPQEELAARAAGFEAVSLGPRVLRADTAPLAALAFVALAVPAVQETTPKAG